MPEVDLERSKVAAYEYLSKIETIKILTVEEKKEDGFQYDDLVWAIDTEISTQQRGLVDLTFQILIPLEFPNSFPKIYIAPLNYEQFKWLPHVDDKRFLCTYDTEKSRPNAILPEQLIHQVVNRAKSILVAGVDGANEADYVTEFLAYWELSYQADDKVSKDILYLPENEVDSENNLYVITLKYSLQGYNYIVHHGGEAADFFKRYLKSIYLKFEEGPGLFLTDYHINDRPPYNLSYGHLIDILRAQNQEMLKKFKSFLNANGDGIAIFKKTVGNRDFKLGYFLKVPFVNNKNRYRKLSNYEKVASVASDVIVSRISPQYFEIPRFQFRSSGSRTTEYHFVMLGLGSVGSHLFSFLETVGDPKFTLIDPDDLRIENIGRHLLGFSYCSQSKVGAMAEYYLGKNPLHRTEYRQESVIKTIENNPSIINSSDYIFVCIGKYNIENYLINQMRSGVINKPMFIFWIEPYLSAGHCLFYHPNDSHSDYFDDFGLFKHNVISDNEYLNENSNLTLSEAGCQTSFVPYSALNVKRFLAAMLNTICDTIQNQPTRSASYTWIGDLSVVKSQGIQLKPELINAQSFELICHQ